MWPDELIAGGMIGSSLLGGLMGSKNSGDNAREANRRSIELARNQALINSQSMSPFIGYGQLAAQDLWGYGPVNGSGGGSNGFKVGITPGGSGGGSNGFKVGITPGGYGGSTVSIPSLYSTGEKWDSPTSIQYQQYGRTGKGFDRTGGAGKYMGRLEDLVSNFKFNTADPAYKYKREESAKSIDRALASRGLYDSRPGVNMLNESDRAIMAEEYDKQYNRQYGGLTDLFNMSSKLGETGYQSLLDAVKVGTGAGATAGSLGNQSVGNMMSAYGQIASQGNYDDANKASFYSGLGAMPMNAMMLYKMLGSGGGGSDRVGW